MGFIRNVAAALRPSNITRGLEAARNPPSQAEIDAQLATLSPEQRAAYEANMARVEEARAEAAASWDAAAAVEDSARVLRGPAGRYVYGSAMTDYGSPAEIEARIAEEGVMSVVRSMRAQRKGELRQALRQTFNRDEVPQERDPAERERIARAERAARDAARAPYRAGGAVPLVISRLATRGETQLAEVVAHLESSGLAAHPERVYGVYRVPDRISTTLTPQSERGRVVEWDIVHAPLEGGAGAGAPVVAASFVAAEHWVARRIGEPSVLDEDLALAYCAEAGVGPERCLGLARVSEFRELRGGDENDDLRTIVKGVVALHGGDDRGAYERMRAAAPIERLRVPDGVHVEVLNWADVARAVHPQIFEPPPVPSPFPYLPATPQELLRAYLEVVGLRPEDCYSAQATNAWARPIIQGGLFTKNWGTKQPCADGKARTRAHMAQILVVAYRDREEYAAGRERWARYQEEVLQARLELGVAVREPVADPADLPELPTRALRAVARVAETVDWLDELGTERLAPYRYCWPPVEP
jgi:hypothetical protein